MNSHKPNKEFGALDGQVPEPLENIGSWIIGVLIFLVLCFAFVGVGEFLS